MTRRRRVPVGTVVAAAVLLTVAAGFGLVARGAWRQGLVLAGGALDVAGISRLLLSTRLSGALRVRRSRWADAAVMLALGATLVVLALVVPDRPG